MTTDDDGLLKVDRLGRVQTPPERREALLDKFEASAMSGKAFAERYGIKYQTFNWWRHRRKRQREGGPVAKGTKAGKKAQSFTLALAEVAGPAGTAAGAVEIELSGGHRLVLKDRRGVALAAALIRELAAS